MTTLAGVPWSSKRIGEDAVFNSPGDVDETLDDDNTILADEQDAQVGSAGDEILEKLLNIAEEDQVGEMDPGSTVHIRHASMSSISDTSGGDSDSDHNGSTGFPNARVEEPLFAHDGEQQMVDPGQPGRERFQAMDKQIEKVAKTNKKGLATLNDNQAELVKAVEDNL